jgi:membrane protease YdiL (CAAX protease family)
MRLTRRMRSEQPYSSVDFRPPPEVRWGLGQFGLGVVAAAIVVVGTLMALGPLGPAWSQPLRFVASIVGYGIFFSVALVSSRRLGAGSMAVDFGLVVRRVDFAAGVGVAVGFELVVLVVGIVLHGLGAATPTPNVVAASDPVWNLLRLGLVSVFIGPVIEELFFRGLLMRAIRNLVLRGPAAARTSSGEPSEERRRTALTVSIVVSAVVFMVLHLYEAVDAISIVSLAANTFIVGVLLGWLATRTGRLGPGIVAHASLNAISVITLLASHR